MNPQTYIDLIPKIGRLLSNKNTYYVLFMASMGFWLWKDEGKITTLEIEKKKSDSLHLMQTAQLQTKIDNKDCADEIRGYIDLLKDIQGDTSKQSETVAKSLEMERKRTEELQQTYELLNQNKK